MPGAVSLWLTSRSSTWGKLMSYAELSLGINSGWPGAALRQFYSHTIAVSPAPTAPSPPGAPSAAYLWIPIASGLGLSVLLVLITGSFGIPYAGRETIVTARLFDSKFWNTRFYASAAWTFGDSGATNITALGTGIAAVLASSAVLTSIFKVDLNPFIIVNVACGGLVATAPILFGIVNFFVVRRDPAVPADASLALHEDATVNLPSGATVVMPGGATVKKADDGPETARVKPGGTIAIAPGSKLTIKPHAIMAVPSGTALTLRSGAVLTANIPIASGDLEPPQTPPAPGTAPKIEEGDLIAATCGAIVTMNGAADVFLPSSTIVTAPGRLEEKLKADITLTVPSGSNGISAGMVSVLAAAFLTTFASGAEIGLVAVLAAHYSTAGPIGRVAAVVIAVIIAIGLIVYGAIAIQSLANPTPGTSLSSEGGTSFTL